MKIKYTEEELDQAAARDIENDIDCNYRQAEEGPFYPERGITKESLIESAERLKILLDKYKGGGMHRAIMNGE